MDAVTLGREEKAELVKRLVAHHVALAMQDSQFITQLYRDGVQLQGYEARSVEDMLGEYAEVFGVEFDATQPAPKLG